MSYWDDLLASPVIDGVRSRVLGIAQGAGLLITDWIQGSTGQQLFETFVSTSFGTQSIIAKAIRGFASLDTSVDPGDVDPFDAGNAALAPAPGFLSNWGQNNHGTTRDEAAFASGFWTFDNSAGVVPRTFSPYGLTFTWTGGSPPSPAPTYRNAPDATIYTGAGGTVTVAAGATLAIPIVADEVGSRSSAPASTITLTTTLVGVIGSNAAAVLGRDREDAATYRVRCREAMARLSLGGPSDAYRYFANTNLDGSPLLNASGQEVAIDRVYVSEDSATGIVDTYYASPGGAPAGADVTAANANIEVQCFAVPDAITFTGLAATPTSVHVVGTAKVKAAPGVSAANAAAGIVSALQAYFDTIPIGGVDQVAGAGVLYTEDLRGVARTGYPGLYSVAVSAPAGSSTAIALGHVATLNSVAGDWTVTLV